MEAVEMEFELVVPGTGDILNIRAVISGLSRSDAFVVCDGYELHIRNLKDDIQALVWKTVAVKAALGDV